MNMHTHTKRPKAFSIEQEKRLCMFAEVPKTGFEKMVEDEWTNSEMPDWFKELVRKTTLFTGEALVWAGRMVTAIPAGFWNGAKEVWNNNVDAGEVKNFFSQVGGFFQELPLIKQYIEYKWGDVVEYKDAKELTDHSCWIKFFREHSAALEMNPMSPDMLQSPQGRLFEKMTIEERQNLFMYYMDTYIPQGEQIKLAVRTNNATPEERRQSAMANLRQVNGTLGAVLGVEDWRTGLSPAEQNIAEGAARDSVKAYYENERLEDETGQMLSNGFISDYETALYGNDYAWFTPAATSTRVALDRLCPSRFRGALSLGVIDGDDLKKAHEAMGDSEYQRYLAIGRVSSNLEFMTDATKREMRKEVMGIQDAFGNLDGWQKLLLIGGGLWLATRQNTLGKFTKNAAIMLTGAYFFQKLVMKEDDPIKKWEEIFGKGINVFKKNNDAAAVNDVTPGEVESVAYRSNVMVRYLDDFDWENMDTQSVGFSLLADMPMSLLAKNVHMTEAGSNWGLQIQNAGLNLAMRQAMESRNWSSRYMEFFNSGNNLDLVEEALGYTFYRVAARDAKNGEKVHLIESVAARLPYGMSFFRLNITALAQKDPQLARDAEVALKEYQKMIAQGRAMAINMNASLLDFIVTEQPEIRRCCEGKKTHVDSTNAATNTVAVGGDASRIATGGAASSAATGGANSGSALGGAAMNPTMGGASSAAATGGTTETLASGGAEENPATGGAASSTVSGGAIDTPTTGGVISEPATGADIDTSASGGVADRVASGDAVSSATSGGVTEKPAFGVKVDTATIGGVGENTADGIDEDIQASGGAENQSSSGSAKGSPAKGGTQ